MTNPMTFKKASAPFLSVALLATALFPHAAHAFSTVTWGSAQNISGDSDVSTLGSLLYAYNAGGPGVTATTVNGVTFSPYVFPSNGTSTTTTGNVTFTETPDILLSFDNLSSVSAPFSNLSSNYQSLLSSGGSAGALGTITATLGGLTAGRDYLFQWWTNDSSNAPWLASTESSAPVFLSLPTTVTLDANTTDSAGGTGQYVIGTFTTGTTGFTTSSLNISLNGIGGLPLINAFQVRDVTSAAVPEPGQIAASLLLLAGIGAYVWLKRRRPAKPVPTR
jgi:hypothetical protein